MVNIVDKDGVYILEAHDFNLKIDNNLRIYVKKRDSKSYDYIGEDLEKGYTADEKKKFLYNLYVKIMEKRKNQE